MESTDQDDYENELNKSIDWNQFQSDINRVANKFEKEWLSFIESRAFTEKTFRDEVGASFLSFIEGCNFDEDLRLILSSLNEESIWLHDLKVRENSINEMANRLFVTLRSRLSEFVDPLEVSKLIMKIVLFSSPSEMLLSYFTGLSTKFPDCARLVGNRLVELASERYCVQFKRELNNKEKFEVSVPFIRTIIFSEQVQAVLVLMNLLRDELCEAQPEKWARLAPVFKLCLDRQAETLKLTTTTAENNLTIENASIRDLFTGNEHELLDPKIESSKLPQIFLSKYQERTVDRVSKGYLSLFREICAENKKLTNPEVMATIVRCVQDYLILEISLMNSNLLILSEVADCSFNELLVVTLDRIRERVFNESQNVLEIDCFEIFIRYDLLAQLLKNTDLVQYLDESREAFAANQVEASLKFSDSILDSDSYSKFIVALGFASPYRLVSSLSWISLSDIEGDVSFDNAAEGDILFKSSLMLSWISYKELEYNKLLVNFSA